MCEGGGNLPLEEFTGATPTSHWTDEIEFTGGEYRLSNPSFYYCLATLPIDALGKQLKLVEEIPGSEDWGIDAIFQRDIDYGRVEEQLVEKYLRREDKFKFFPPLTIALLPYNAQNNKILDAYQGEFTQETSGSWNVDKYEGIQIHRMVDTTVGKIRWDRRKIFAIAIDGQHRLAALEMLQRKYPVDGSIPIPIAIVVFHHESEMILTHVRELFIDINKTAVPVSKSREILLDDRDPFAVFTRDLVTQDDSGIRYEVVDWKRDSPVPDGESQITSLVVLYEMVKSLLKTDPRKFFAILGLHERLSSIGDLPESPTLELNDRQMVVATEAFGEGPKRFLLALFKTIEPFRSFTAAVEEKIGHGEQGVALKRYLLSSPNQREKIERAIRLQGWSVENVVDEPLNDLQDMKRDYGLIFTSIGQRGLVFWHHQYAKILTDAVGNSPDVMAENYASHINDLFEKGFFNRTFSVSGKSVWQGLVLDGEKIRPNMNSVKRIGAFIILSLAAKQNGSVDGIEESPGYALKTPFSTLSDYLVGQLKAEDSATDESPDEEQELEFVDEEQYRELAKNRIYEVLEILIES